MGIFDFFNKNKKERERQEQMRLQQEAARNRVQGSNSNSLKALVDKCSSLEVNGQITELQNCLFQIYTQFNRPGGGRAIINYSEKNL